MALNIKNTAVESLASEVAAMANESKTEAIRRALEERKLRLRVHRKPQTLEQMMHFLQTEIWPHVPARVRGKRIPKKEWEDILGYGPKGVSE
jgi:antitoxin VapB